MAESLPRYQHPGVLLGEVPRYDYAHIKEGVRGSAQLYDSLNRLSEWAFSQAAEEAKTRGEQYGAENPVTTQQLLDGTANFADPKSIHGKAARGIQLDTLTTDMEIEASNKLAGLKARAEAGEIDVAGAAAEIRDMQDGYSSALARVDPKASNKFRGNVATAGNSVLMAIQKSAGTKAREAQKINIDNWIEGGTLEQMVKAAIEAGDTVDPTTGQKITPKMRLDVLRSTLRGATTAVGDDEYARGANRRAEAIIETASVGAVMGYANSPEYAKGADGKFNAMNAVARADKGDFGPYTSLFQSLDYKQQAGIRSGMRSLMADRYTQDEHDRVERKRVQTLESNGLITEYLSASPARKTQIANRLRAISTDTGAITGMQINELIKPKSENVEPKPNHQAEFIMREEIKSGRINTGGQILERGAQLGMPWKQRVEMQGVLDQRDNREYNRGLALLVPGSGIGVGAFNPSQQRAQNAVALQRDFHERFTRAQQAYQSDPQRNPPPSARSLADEIVIERQKSPFQQTISNNVKMLNEQFGGTTGATKATGLTFTEYMDVDQTARSEMRAALEKRGVNKTQIGEILEKMREIEIARMQLNKLEQR